MATFEKEATTSVHKALAKATAIALERFDEELFRTKDKTLISKGFESRKMLETYGELSFKRRRYSCKGHNLYLLDEVLGLPKNTSFSSSVTHFLATHARSDSYESATRHLEEHCGFKVRRASVKAAIAKTAKALREAETESPRE
jgi:hypothetical protein